MTEPLELHDADAIASKEGEEPRGDADSVRLRLIFLCGVFVVSGFCGLIYESIWSHYLKLFVGHAAYAQTVVLIVFIGGMAIGAWLIGRITHRVRAPLLAYAAVEATVGVLSLGFHKGFVFLTEWGYSTLLPAACSPDFPCVAQWLLAAGMILPQSILLGTTFPLMTAGILRLAPESPGSRIALFYFLNSIGAVFGVLAAAFVLIPALGLPGALLTAGLMNIAVAVAAYVCGKDTKGLYPSAPKAKSFAKETPGLRRLLIAVAALTGLSSFVYEIVWIRMLSLVIGASTDAFELMLAAFILGLALGGLWVRKRIDRFRDLLIALAVVQVLMGIAAALTLPIYDRMFDLLAWLMHALNRTTEGYLLYNLASHAIALIIMLPATMLAGMTLPLITTALLRGRQGEGAIGFVYAANTLGAIVGVALAVHFAMPVLGLKSALLFGAAIDVALGLAVFYYNRQRTSRRLVQGWSAAGLATLVLVAAIVPISLDRIASGVYRHGTPRLGSEFAIVFHEDGKTANVDVVRVGDVTSIRTNGKSDAAISQDPSTPTSDEYTMALIAILPLALHPSAEHAAVIGFGSGMTTDTLLRSPRLKRVDTIEIEPEMVEGARHFGPAVARAYEDPRSRIVIDDAKSFFARSGFRYDLIVSEPSNPWVSGVASLFTAEFYARVKQQLADGGLFVQWVQMYEFSNPLLATILRALDREFVDYAVYQSNNGDLIIIAGNGDLPDASGDFLSFPELRPTLDRLSFASLDEIELRRIAGAETVRAMLSQMGPGVNSDYYPLVDIGATRERFLRSEASAFVRLTVAPLPVVEMLEARKPIDLSGIAPGFAHHERRVSMAVARTTAAWLTSGTSGDEPLPMPRDVGLLRAMLWRCAEPPPRMGLDSLMFQVATFVNPHLPPADASRVWFAVRSAPCAFRMTAADRKWLDLYEAVAMRDAKRMAHIGQELLAMPEGALTADTHPYALGAAVVGLLATGHGQAAGELLDRELSKLPDTVRNDSMFLMLKGYAVRRGP